MQIGLAKDFWVVMRTLGDRDQHPDARPGEVIECEMTTFLLLFDVHTRDTSFGSGEGPLGVQQPLDDAGRARGLLELRDGSQIVPRGHQGRLRSPASSMVS